MHIKDRIKEFKRIYAKDLLPNPANWRTHPQAQSDTLRGILAEVGWADAVLARETKDGLMLVDGHLRSEVASDKLVPVLILDVTDEEADKLLVTLAPACRYGRDQQRSTSNSWTPSRPTVPLLKNFCPTCGWSTDLIWTKEKNSTKAWRTTWKWSRVRIAGKSFRND